MKKNYSLIPAPLKKLGMIIGAGALLFGGVSTYQSLTSENDIDARIGQIQQEQLDKYMGMMPEDIKKMPKYDRPDLATLQDFEMTRNPKLGYIPVEQKLKTFAEIKNRLKNGKAIAGVNWTERGPNNVGGRTKALMFDPNDANNRKVWAAGVAGGIWYNNNITSSTTQWQNVNDFWANLAVTTMAYDPSNTQTFYAGTGEGFMNADAVRGAGIWKSTNGGTTWAQLSGTNNSNFYYVQKVAVTNSGTVLAATRNGLFRSTNGGSSWTSVVSGVAADIEVASNGNIYASTGLINTPGNLYKSTNDGASFSDITPATGGERMEIASAPSNGNILYVVASSGSDVAWFRKSTNGGSSWTNVTIPKYLEQGSCAAGTQDFTRGQAWYDLILAVHPTNPNIVLAGGIDIHKSTNGGSSWSSITYWTGACGPEVHADQHAIQFRPGSPNEAIFGNDGGVAYSTNVGSASSPSFGVRNNGYNVTQFYAVAMANTSGSNLMIAGAQDNGSQKFTTSGVNSTSEVSGGDGAFCHIDQDNSNYQITSYVYNSYYRSTNGGGSFSQILNVAGRGRFINPTDYDNDANTLYASGNADEYIRVAGITGTVAAAAVPVSLGGGKISSVIASPNTANRIYVGTEKGTVYRIDGADGTPSSVTNISGSFPTNGYVSCIEIGSSDNQLLATFSNYGVTSVYQSTNGGSSWASKEGNLPDLPVRFALYNPNNNNEVMLATEAGVWSTDEMNVSSPNWEITSAGLANVRCDMLQYRTSDGLVAVATHGRGVFTADAFAGGGGGGGNPTACASSISAFPYSEGFESGAGAWTQATGDDLDWTRQQNGTPSGSTGPTAASAGSYYMFVEASSPNYPSKTTYLNSPCFDLTGESTATFTFDYNMNGAAMGSLTLQASTDGSTWANVFTVSGDQGTAWKSASVNLVSYLGDEVRLRFNGTTGTNYTSDISIDKLALSAGAAAPTCNVPSGLTSSAITSTSFTVSWGAISGASTYDVEVNGALISDDVAGTSLNVTGASASTAYAVKVKANCSGGSSAFSSALNVTTSAAPTTGCAGGINSFPYSESFESGLGAWSQGSGDDLDWARTSGGTPSGNTGPTAASAGSNYMYVEASSPNYPSKTTYFNSPCFNLSSASAATFGFDYHMNGTDMGSLTLQASTNNGSSWASVWTISGSQGTAWKSQSVDLASFAGASVQLRFVGVTGAGWSSDIAVDDISLTTGTSGGGGSSTSTVTLALKLDNYPTETSWVLQDASGTTVASGSGYTDAQKGLTINRSFSLPAGCYDFVISDSYGDGICCAEGSGNYTLSDGSTTLATGGAYGSGETKNFCVGGATSNIFTPTNAFTKLYEEFGFEAYPNPANSYISIRLAGATEAQYSVFDLTGRKVRTGSIQNGTTSVKLSGLSSGIYMIKASDGTSTVVKKFIKK
jgi:hypothetical protein